MLNQKKYIVFWFIFILTFVFHGCFLSMKPVAVESLHNIRGYYDKENRELSLTFVFVDSWLTIVDYDLNTKNDEDGRNIYYLTLVGKYQGKGQEATINESIKKEQGSYHLTLKNIDLDLQRDEIDYKDGRQKVIKIPVSIK